MVRYGDDKGACENIFSYGFLEDSMETAKVMFLDLDIPDDDPLRPAKIHVCTVAPGFRLFEKGSRVEWESDFIWLVVVNEEDGIEFRIKQTIDGKREPQALWKNQELNDTSKLRGLMEEDALWNVFQLRAVVLLQNRIEMQIGTLAAMEALQRDESIREGPWNLAARLRKLEFEMLQRAASSLDDQVRNLSIHSSCSKGPTNPDDVLASPSTKRPVDVDGCANEYGQRTSLLDSEAIKRYLGLVGDEGIREEEQVDFS